MACQEAKLNELQDELTVVRIHLQQIKSTPVQLEIESLKVCENCCMKVELS